MSLEVKQGGKQTPAVRLFTCPGRLGWALRGREYSGHHLYSKAWDPRALQGGVGQLKCRVGDKAGLWAGLVHGTPLWPAGRVPQFTEERSLVRMLLIANSSMS